MRHRSILTAAVLLLTAPTAWADPPDTRLYVKTEPSEARVLMDGVELGKSGAEFHVRPGKHMIVIEKSAYARLEQQVDLREGKIEHMELKLKPDAASAASAHLSAAPLPDGLAAEAVKAIAADPEATDWFSQTDQMIVAIAAVRLPDEPEARKKTGVANQDLACVRAVAKLLLSKVLLDRYPKGQFANGEVLQEAVMRLAPMFVTGRAVKIEQKATTQGDFAIAWVCGKATEVQAWTAAPERMDAVSLLYRDILRDKAGRLMERGRHADAVELWQQLFDRGDVTESLYLDAARCFTALHQPTETMKVLEAGWKRYADAERCTADFCRGVRDLADAIDSDDAKTLAEKAIEMELKIRLESRGSGHAPGGEATDALKPETQQQAKEMSMKYLSTLRQNAAVSAVLTWFVLPIFGAPTTGDSFVEHSPARGGPREIAVPAAVHVDGDVVRAATDDDAVKGCVNVTKKRAQEAKTNLAGAMHAIGANGEAITATAGETYNTYENPDATRLDKRLAYVKAFEKAKVELAGYVNVMPIEARRTMQDLLQRAVTDQETLNNLKQAGDEGISATVTALLKGVVVWDVVDDAHNSTVWVSVVTSPKTCAGFNSMSRNHLACRTKEAAVEQVIAEVQNFVVPPMGGKIIHLPSEIGVVGFGSAVIPAGNSQNAKNRNRLDAISIAELRAKAELMALLKGDEIVWHGKICEKYTKQFEQFDKVIGAEAPATIKKLDKERETFIDELRHDNLIESATRGILPAGVATRVFIDEEQGWAFAVAIFLPSETEKAQEQKKLMDRTNLEAPEPGVGRADGAPLVKPTSPAQPATRSAIPAPVGPSGRVSNPNDIK